MTEEKNEKTLEEKTCAWFILGKPYKNCYYCEKYDDKCNEYIPLFETPTESIIRISRQLNLRYI